jgi:cell division protein FtsI (penicillin-binding protein 3)
MRGLVIGVLFVLSLFAAQLLRIQGFDSANVAAEALKQRTEAEAVPAMRGKILSSDGVVLAASRPRETVVADPQAVCTYQTKKNTCQDELKAGALSAAAAALAPLLGKPASEIGAKFNTTSRYVVLDRQVTPLTWRKISALGIPGIYTDNRPGVSVPERVYPQGPTAASLVGFVTDNGLAGGGVEEMVNSTLTGKTGESIFERAPSGIPIPGGRHEITKAVDGKDVTLTINSNLQWYAQNAIAQKIQETEALSGTVVVMNAKTGQLLALASYPTFDPNDIGHAKGDLVNKAFNDVFEPGSTAKIMTIAAALEEKKVTPSTPVVIPNRLHRYDTWFKDSHDHPTEYRTVAGTLAESSNIGTVLIGETLTSKQLETYFRKFGLGSTSGMGYPGESAGLLAPSEKWSGTQRSTVKYGQGVSVTAIQAASVFQTIANGGLRVPPRLIAGTTDADGAFVKAPQPEGQQVVSPEIAREVNLMLEGVVSKEGTAPQAQIPGYRVAGKTGTADRYDPVAKAYSGKTASFIGFAPADDPQIVVAVIIQRPLKGYFGGSTAGPVFHDVMTYALQEFKVPPTGTPAPKVTLKLDGPPAPGTPGVIQDSASAPGR